MTQTIEDRTTTAPPGVHWDDHTADIIDRLRFGGLLAIGAAGALTLFAAMHLLGYGGWNPAMLHLLIPDALFLAGGLGMRVAAPALARRLAGRGF